MSSKFLPVFLLIILSGFVITNSIPEKVNDTQLLLKSQKESPNTEELKRSFHNSTKINLWSYFWKILSIFLILLGVIFAIYKFTGDNSVFSRKLNQDNHFKILYQHYLSSRQKILLIKSFDKFILLGVTDQSINKITEFQQHEIDEKSLVSSQSQPFFNALLGKKYKNG